MLDKKHLLPIHNDSSGVHVAAKQGVDRQSGYLYWKCKFPMNPGVRLLVGCLAGRSVCHNFQSHLHAPIIGPPICVVILKYDE